MAKAITKIKTPSGHATEQDTILAELRKFYETLYTSNAEIKFAIPNTSGTMLTDLEKDNLDRDFVQADMFKAIKEMQAEKAPGLDGVPVEIYEVLYSNIESSLYNMYMYSKYEAGMLSRTAKRGVISLLPKGNKDPLFLKNWRPLTLLNVDYKILAKIMATKLKPLLENKLIGNQQTGFMKNRNITDNIKKTMDVVAYSNLKKKRYVIMTIDFEKCFDRIEYNAVFGAMSYFNIGPGFTQWVRLFFSEFYVCTQNMGYMSEFFKKTRGVNQGCNYSPFAYLLCGEVMAHRLQNNPDIRGVNIHEVYMLLSQFADDTALFLEYDEIVINAVIDELEFVETNTGLRISYEKTTVYRIGSAKDSIASMVTKKPLTWSDGDIELLGMRISNCATKQSNEGYDKSIKKMEQVCKSWANRRLTLMGKCLVINTLMASLFVYGMSTMGEPSNAQYASMDNILTEYLWGSSKPKIPLKILRLRKCKGGLGLVDFRLKFKTLQLQWIPKTINNSSFRYVYSWFIPELEQLIWSANLSVVDIKNEFCDSYWRDVLIQWSTVHYRTVPEVSKENIPLGMIWCNSNIKIGKKTVFFKKWFLAGIVYISALLTQTGNIQSLEELRSNYGEIITVMQYNQLCAAIPSTWKYGVYAISFVNEPVKPLFIDTGDLLKRNKIASYMYKFISAHSSDTVSRYLDKWNSIFHTNLPMAQFEKAFKALYKTCSSTKLRNFQYKILIAQNLHQRYIVQMGDQGITRM